MTRINTNVSSLVAQNRLQASNKDLQTALTRLSTGLRINSGSDDPAGLIASEALRSEITSLNKSISNTRRASQIISTADSALGQVSNLLNDIRGLVVEAANNGALSPDEVAANQLQVDSSLEAINRIAQTTTFQGRKLLDGSLDFITSGGTGSTNIKALQIEQAGLGATGKVDVNINVSAAATQASIDVEGFRETANAVTGVAATGSIDFSVETQAAVAATASIEFGTAGNTTTLAITNTTPGAAGNGATVTFAKADLAGGVPTATVDGSGNITVTIDETVDTAIADIAAAIDGLANFSVASTDAGTGAADFSGSLDAAPAALTFAGGSDAINDTATINITAAETGVAFNGTVNFQQVNGTTAPTASFSGGVLTVTVNDTGSISLDAVASAINSLDDFTATRNGALANFAGDNATLTATETNLTGGIDQQLAGAQANVVFELAGTRGSEVFNISAGTSMEDLVSQINLVSDATGVQATADGTQLQLRSTDYGSRSKVEVRVITEGAGGNFGIGGRDTGDDIVATVNGRAANGVGNRLSINTGSLNMKADIEVGFTGDAQFTISGGGANFQLGPEVVSNQQARVGISSVNSARLGGVAGKLFELGSGEAASLENDPTRAAQIVTEAINQVTGLRGRLGAFQSTSLESNLVSLSDTVANLQEAESSIRDADFAAESAALTRAQILVQSGTNVLALANQNPQNVLSLLR